MQYGRSAWIAVVTQKRKYNDERMQYIGGKFVLSKYICPILQKCIDENNITTYLEPFVGGANIIDKIKCKRRIGCDINRYLIALYKHLQNGGKIEESISREQYHKVKESFKAKDKKYPDWLYANVGFMASYRSKFFGGYGATNRREPHLDTDYVLSKRSIYRQIHMLADVEFYCYDFQETLSDAQNQSNWLVFCDPPYFNSNYKVQYNLPGFDFKALYETLNEMSRHHFVFVSEAIAELPKPIRSEVVFEKVMAHSFTRNNPKQDKPKKTEKLFRVYNQATGYNDTKRKPTHETH